jgi:hypothetical protein
VYGAQAGRVHPVLDMQRSLNGGHIAEPSGGGFFDDAGDFIDSTPRAVAVLIAGSAIFLFLLKRAGFRFNFGVGANIGK